MAQKKRLFKDGQSVWVKAQKCWGTVVGYRKGNPYPYKVQLSQGGRAYCSFRGLSTSEPTKVTVAKPQKEGDMSMGNIREKIRVLTKSKEDRLFEETGIISDHGNLTDLGRRVVLDKLWEDKELREAILADVEAVVKAEKDCKKNK